MKLVKLELTPYNAIAILSFLREFINKDNSDEYQFNAIHEAVDEYEKEVYAKVSNEALDEISITNQVNQLIGKSPMR